MSLLTHYQERLGEAVKVSRDLSEQISALLEEGATLEDERIVALTTKRTEAHTAVESFTETLAAEGQLEAADSAAATALEQYSGHGASTFVQAKPASEQGSPQPFQSFGQMLGTVVQAGRQPHMTDPRLREMEQFQIGLGETIPSEGGFLVQTDFSTELLKRVHNTGIIFGKPRHIPIGATANGLKINAIDEVSRVDGSRIGGIRAFWTAEATALTASRPTFRQIELSLHKLTGLYYATNEELSDTVALEETVSSFFAEEFGFKLDDALIRGTGAGEPLGILGHAGTVDVAAEAGQGANTIVLENIQAMYSRAWARSLLGATWYINQDTWTELFSLEAAVGTGGVPVFLPSNQIAGAPFGTILGLPIQPIEQCATLGTSGDIILANFGAGYVMIDKGGISSAVSIHVQFLTDESVFRFILRTDGQPISNAALTPYQGTVTQSSFLTLATR